LSRVVLTSKEIKEPIFRKTSTFSVKNKETQETKQVHYNMYIINGNKQLLDYHFSFLGVLAIEEMQSGATDYVFGITKDHAPEMHYKSRIDRFDHITKCFNIIGDVDKNEDNIENKFSYLQFRLFDEENNDLSMNEDEYEIIYPSQQNKTLILNLIKSN